MTHQTLRLGKCWKLFRATLKQDECRALIKTTCHVHIGIVKFVTLLKESPCSPVVTFPSFDSEGHGVQPPQGDSFLYICFQLHLCVFVQSPFFHLLNEVMSVLKSLLTKDIKPAL